MPSICEKCGAPMAAVDEVCPQCGEKISSVESSRRWRERGLTLEKQARERTGPAGLEQAGEAYAKARDLDDGNETLHQLWIANRSNLGKAEQALEYYKKRLVKDPGDALATKMLSASRLALEFKLNPIKVAAPSETAKGFLGRGMAWLLTPNRFNLGMAASSFLISLVLLVAGFFFAPSSAPALSASSVPGSPLDDATGALAGMLFSPLNNLVSCLIWGAYFAYLWKVRKR
jgi:hypothetical protein